MCVASTPVVTDDAVYCYYTGLSTTHGGKSPEKKASVARAKWRLDGFVSLDAGDQAATVETTAWRGEGRKLLLNADASGGEITVALIDPASGKPLAGYAAD